MSHQTPDLREDTRLLTMRAATARVNCDRLNPECLFAAQLNNLTELGYLEMTPAQAAALPVIWREMMCVCRPKTGGAAKRRRLVLGSCIELTSLCSGIDASSLSDAGKLADQGCWRARRPFSPNTVPLDLCGGQPLAAQRDSLSTLRISLSHAGAPADHLQKKPYRWMRCTFWYG